MCKVTYTSFLFLSNFDEKQVMLAIKYFLLTQIIFM